MRTVSAPQRRVPAHHVGERRVQPPVAAQGPVGCPGLLDASEDRAPVLAAAVAVRDAGRVPARGLVAGLGHAGGLQDELAEGRLVVFAGRLLDDGGEQAVARVRVLVALARGEEELGGERAPGVLLSGRRLVVGGAEVRLEARGVGEQVLERDPRLVRGHAVEEAGDGVARLQLPQLLEAQDRGGGERLGDRAEVEDGVGAHRDAAIAVGVAVALQEDGLAALHDREAA